VQVRHAFNDALVGYAHLFPNGRTRVFVGSLLDWVRKYYTIDFLWSLNGFAVTCAEEVKYALSLWRLACFAPSDMHEAGLDAAAWAALGIDLDQLLAAMGDPSCNAKVYIGCRPSNDNKAGLLRLNYELLACLQACGRRSPGAEVRLTVQDTALGAQFMEFWCRMGLSW
jgi:hypothetical protein